MNVVTAAPVPAPPARAPHTAAPAAAGDDFAAVLAGLGEAGPNPTTLPEEPAGAGETDPAGEDAAAPGDAQAALDTASLAVPAPVPGHGPVPDDVLPAGPPAAGSPAVAPVDAAAPPTPAEPARGLPVGAEHTAGTAAGAQAAVLTGRPAAPGPPADPAGGTARASEPGAPALPLAVQTGAAPLTASGADPAVPAAPDALELAVPDDLTGDAPAPVLDARSAASPAGTATAAQTAGGAVVEAVLPAEHAAAGPVDVPRADVAATVTPVGAPAGAEAGVAAAPPADPRASAPAAAAPAAAPPPAPPAAPAAQVVQLLSPVLTGPDGSYRLSLQLYPEELGAVQVEVLLRGGEIRLALHAPDEAAQAALRAALPDLRADLQSGGLSATSLSVDDGRAGQSSEDRSADRRPDGSSDSPGRRPHPYRDADPAPRPPTSHSDAALDLRM